MALAALAAPAPAQLLTLGSRFDLYGDHVESDTPYRASESLLSSQGRGWLEYALPGGGAIRGGLFFDHESGSAQFADKLRPILAYRLNVGQGAGILGTLDTVARHGFIEPLEVDELEITRPIEYGAQFVQQTEDVGADVFINWQQLASATQSGLFDYGGVVSRSLVGPLAGEVQVHGTRDAGGGGPNPSGTNIVAAPGLRASGDLGPLGWSELAAYGLFDHDTLAGPPTDGRAGYVRLTLQPGGWFELIGQYWRSWDFISTDGDPNDRAGDVEEVGIRRRLPLSLDSSVEAEERNQWVAGRYVFWVRLVGRLRFGRRISG